MSLNIEYTKRKSNILEFNSAEITPIKIDYMQKRCCFSLWSHPEVTVRFCVLRQADWLVVWQSAHDFLYFVLGHLVFFQSYIVAEEATTELVSYYKRNKRSQADTKDHVE